MHSGESASQGAEQIKPAPQGAGCARACLYSEQELRPSSRVYAFCYLPAYAAITLFLGVLSGAVAAAGQFTTRPGCPGEYVSPKTGSPPESSSINRDRPDPVCLSLRCCCCLFLFSPGQKASGPTVPEDHDFKTLWFLTALFVQPGQMRSDASVPSFSPLTTGNRELGTGYCAKRLTDPRGATT